MNSVILIKLILCFLSFCYSEEVENKTEEIDDNIVMRQRRGQVHSLNKLNNDSVKLKLDLNNIGSKLLKQRPIILQKPITNLRIRAKPPINRINLINKTPSPPSQSPKKDEAPPKVEEEVKIETPAIENTTKVEAKPNKPVFFTEKDSDDDFFEESDSDSTKQSIVVKDKLQTTSEEKKCGDDKKDKNDVIIGIIKELPDLIKTVVDERLKSEGSPIIIKNITEITLPIQRGNEMNITTSICLETSNDGQTDAKTMELEKKTSRYNKELVDLLLKPILNKNNAQGHYGDKSNGRIESIKIKQQDYSEIVEQNREPSMFTSIMNENEQTGLNTEAEHEESCASDGIEPGRNQYYPGSYSIDGVEMKPVMYPFPFGSNQQQSPAMYPCAHGSIKQQSPAIYPCAYAPNPLQSPAMYPCTYGFNQPQSPLVYPFAHDSNQPQSPAMYPWTYGSNQPKPHSMYPCAPGSPPQPQPQSPTMYPCLFGSTQPQSPAMNLCGNGSNQPQSSAMYPCMYNSNPIPKYTEPLHPNTNNPHSTNTNMIYPYQHTMPPPQNFNSGYSSLNRPKHYAENGIRYPDTNGVDDKKNKTWKSWTNTEIVIRKNNDNDGNCHNKTLSITPYPRTYYRYSSYCPNRFMSSYGSQPYPCYPRLFVTH